MRYVAGVDLELLSNLLSQNNADHCISISKCCTSLINNYQQQLQTMPQIAEFTAQQDINTVATLKQLLKAAESNPPNSGGNLHYLYHHSLDNKLNDALLRVSNLAVNNESLRTNKRIILGYKLAFFSEFLAAFNYVRPVAEKLSKLYDTAARLLRKAIQALLLEPDPNPDPGPAHSAPRPQLRQDWLCALANTPQASYTQQQRFKAAG